MISVVYSSHRGKVYDANFEKMLQKTSGSRKPLDIVRMENYGSMGLSEAYNKGLVKARYPIVVFIHNDVYFREGGWALKVRDEFKRRGWSILGAAGAKSLQPSQQGCWWKGDGGMSPYMAGCVYHTDGSKLWKSQFSDRCKDPEPAVLVDGVFIAVDKNRIKHWFDEDFGGFHFYDLSFCLPNLLDGCNIGIMHDLEIVHESVGKTNQEWEDAKEVFFSKYGGDYCPNMENLGHSVTHSQIHDGETPFGVDIIIPLGQSDKRQKFFYDYCLPSIESMGVANTILVEGYGSAPEKRNIGLSMSTSEFVLFCDDDIIFPESWLEDAMEAMKSDISFVYSGYHGIVMKPDSHPIGKNFTINPRPFSLEALKGGNYISTMSLIRKSHLPEKPFDESLPRLQDWDLFLGMALRGRKGVPIDNKFMAFYNDVGITSKGNPYSDSERAIREKYEI